MFRSLIFGLLVCGLLIGIPARSSAGAKHQSARVVNVYKFQKSHVVLLKTIKKKVLVPIWIGRTEALAISLRLARQAPPRPLTHNLLEKLLRELNAKVVKVVIEDIKDNTYLGRIFLKQGKRTFSVDARPSDSIALAVGAKAPIFVSAEVLKKAGLKGKNPKLELKTKSKQPTPKKPTLKGSI